MSGSKPGSSTSRVRSTVTATTRTNMVETTTISVQTVNVDVAAEAEGAWQKYTEHRENDEAARKGMREQVERVMKLIRVLRRDFDHWSIQSETEQKRSEEARAMVESVAEMVRSIFQRFPNGCIPSSGGNDELTRLEEAVKALVKMVTEAEDELSNCKRQVPDLKKEISQIRADADELQRTVDEAMAHLRALCNNFDDKMSLGDLVKTVRKLLDEEKRAKSEAEKTLQGEKKKMDEMLNRRREFLNVLHQLFEQCREMERLMKQLGLRMTSACPKEVNDKKHMAMKFERALGWLIAQISVIINELHATKRRLDTANDQLRRSELDSQQTAEQRDKLNETIRKLTSDLEDLKTKFHQAAKQNENAQKQASDIRKVYLTESQRMTRLQEQKKNEWQQLTGDCDKKANSLREELDALRKEMSDLRGQTTELSDRIECSLRESTALREKLDREKKGLGRRNWGKEAAIRKLNADLVAAETEAKEVERETQEYVEEFEEMKKELERRSGWRHDTKIRLDSIRKELELEKPELDALKEDAGRLQDKIKANERTLETRNARYQEMQRVLNDLGKKRRRLEDENQALRWRVEELPEAPEKEPAPCPTCATNAEVADLIPELRRQHQQLQAERVELGERAARVRRELELAKDTVVEKKTEKTKTLRRRSASTSKEQSDVSQPMETPKRRSLRKSRKSPLALRNQVEERIRRAVAEVTGTPQTPTSSKVGRSRRTQSLAEPRTAAAARSTGVRRQTRSATRSPTSARAERDRSSTAAVGTRVSTSAAAEEGASSTVSERGVKDVLVTINANVRVNEVTTSECTSVTAEEEGYDVSS